MAIELPEVEMEPCPVCGLKVPVNELQKCEICHSVTCEYCGVADFGRSFCATKCRDFFFWGDGDQDERDY